MLKIKFPENHNPEGCDFSLCILTQNPGGVMGSSGTAPGKCSAYSQEQADHQTRRAKIRTHGCRSKAKEISMIYTSHDSHKFGNKKSVWGVNSKIIRVKNIIIITHSKSTQS